MYIKHRGRNTGKRLTSLFLLISGIMLLLMVVLPMLSWQLFYAPNFSSGTILLPIPKAIVIGQTGQGGILSDTDSRKPTSFDSIRANSWFPTGNPKSGATKEYFLSIPKLGIKNAKVIVGADDLTKSLIHYGGSSMPSEYGNTVVFGHSILPQFYNPKNYKAIFSTLHTLKPGDAIEVESDGATYSYSIFALNVIDPSDISVLEQVYDNSYLTLITCTPPGTYWKRLIVKARIDKI